MILKAPVVNMIACVDKNWAIGRDGNLLFHIPADMQRFQSTTKGSNIIYGRKTLDTFPEKRALKDRINILLTHQKDIGLNDPTIKIVHSVFDAFQACNTLVPIWVIGGQSIYEQFLPYAYNICITKVDTEIEDANAFFPNLDKISDFECNPFNASVKEVMINGQEYSMEFCSYQRKGTVRYE